MTFTMHFPGPDPLLAMGFPQPGAGVCGVRQHRIAAP